MFGINGQVQGKIILKPRRTSLSYQCLYKFQNNRSKTVGAVHDTKLLEIDRCLEKWLSSRGDNFLNQGELTLKNDVLQNFFM